MAEIPGPVARVNRYLAAAMIAHESIANLHDELALQSRSDDETRRLFREAGRIAAIEVPAVLRESLRLWDRWTEQDLLDPDAATETLRLIAEELDRVEPDVKRMRARQDEIARELRQRLGDLRG